MRRVFPVLLLFALAWPGVAEANRYVPSNVGVKRGVRPHDWRQRRHVRSRRSFRAPEKHRGDLPTLLTSFARWHPHTLGHSLRVGAMVEATAREMGLSGAAAARYGRAAMVHDIGKLEVPLAILGDTTKRSDPNQPALSKKQFDVMKRHTGFGAKLLQGALSPKHRDYKLMRDAILFHHERLDGKGYQHRGGVKIPFIARLVAVADVYDALTSKRPYHEALPRQKVLAILEEGAGKKYDPKIVKAFTAQLKKHGGYGLSARNLLVSLASTLAR